MKQSTSQDGSPDDWALLRTPDGFDVLILLDDINAVWSGTLPGTIILELVSREDPLAINYSSVKRFAAAFLPHFDARRKGVGEKKKPLSLRVVSERGSG